MTTVLGKESLLSKITFYSIMTIESYIILHIVFEHDLPLKLEYNFCI